MSTIKDSILALFDDNITGAITASDLRIFVDTIFDSKENNINVFDRLSEIDTYLLNENTKYPIQKFDIISITDNQHQQNWGSEKGIYIALKDSPTSSDVLKISSLNYDEFIKSGSTGQLISLDSTGNLVWIEPIEGYYIEGTDTITNILNKRPSQKGPIWIATNEELTAPVPGKIGDGYSWDGIKWTNIGALRGPEGDVVQVAFANQYEVDGGYIDYKAISPKTFKNSTLLTNKEDRLGAPSMDGMMLVSTVSGNRSWEKPVTFINDLTDVDYTTIDNNSLLIYNNGIWSAIKVSDITNNTFLGLSDTPSSFGGAGQAVVVNTTKTGLTFSSVARHLGDLLDVSDSISPSDGDVLKYNAGTGFWTAAPDTSAAGISSGRPLNPKIGFMYFDTSLGIPIWFNGTHWVNANGQQI